MRRRFRRKSFRRRGRRTFRRRFIARRAYRIARSVSRKMAGEVKKLDFNAIVPESKFTQITPAYGSAADNATSLPDFGYVYDIFSDNSSVTNQFSQGGKLGQFTGNQIRAKYLYLGIHIQMPVRVSGATAESVQQPLCVRCIIVQDRNYIGGMTLAQLVGNLFGVSFFNQEAADTSYTASADYTLLPINPSQPGRFRVIRDFKMTVAPGSRMDYYKKIMLLQRDMLSSGRFYAGGVDQNNQPPTESTSSFNTMRNRIYALFLYQSPTIYGANTAGSPDFTISVQTRLAYYDN